MSNTQQFKVRDKIVDSGQVCIVYKIEKDRIFNGEKEDCIYYRPYYKTDKNRSLVCSVPENNIEEANLRKPVPKKKIKEALKILGKKSDGETKVTHKEACVYIKKNNPVETARLLRLLWIEKQNEEEKFVTRKKTMYKNAVRHLVEEISVVHKIGLREARKKISRRLKKIYTEKKDEENDN